MTLPNSSAFSFDDIRVEPATFRAFKAGQQIQLEPKALRLLLFLIENRDRAVEKEEILNTIWSGTYVTENALTREIAKLRKLLGDDPKAPKYIQTVHTLGYRFIAELDEKAGPVSAPAQEGDTVAPPEHFIPRESTAPKRAHSRRTLTTAITIAIALAIVSAIVGWKRRSAMVSPPATAANSVAILPFKT